MCMAANGVGGQQLANLRIPPLDDVTGLIMKAFLSDFPQHQPEPNDNKCSEISFILKGCDPMLRAYGVKKCSWMFSSAHFLKCYDDTISARKVLNLFKMCVQSWCQFNPCTAAITAITDAGCGNLNANVPELSDFMDGQLCPPHL
ncbi:hypothetical protein PoB_003821800 [Plakobranchus ocellatus]|uniref:Uncharacterized protein n=1 Tax=Plakobranchus ocellatus TaxID=259542 RepID=A0AAV4AYY4_9GAST|nr:hypothetical protein PoB_003821800 [Plakobranchus ocellatus]